MHLCINTRSYSEMWSAKTMDAPVSISINITVMAIDQYFSISYIFSYLLIPTKTNHSAETVFLIQFKRSQSWVPSQSHDQRKPHQSHRLKPNQQLHGNESAADIGPVLLIRPILTSLRMTNIYRCSLGFVFNPLTSQVCCLLILMLFVH